MTLHLKTWQEMMHRRLMAEKALGQALKYLGKDPDKNAKYLLKAVDHIASGEKQEMIRSWFHHWMRENGPGRQFLHRLVQNTHPRVRERYVARMVAGMFFRDPEARTVRRKNSASSRRLSCSYLRACGATTGVRDAMPAVMSAKTT
ncbi:MAG: hypothetical protein U5L07_09700 [Desulfobacterales bacterium]|nr:hypothetical protein [Desulfobacterales bacterium]